MKNDRIVAPREPDRLRERFTLFPAMKNDRTVAAIGASGLALLFVALLAAAGCSHEERRPAAVSIAAAEFVSETECAACHAAVSKSCAGTNHARTLRPAGRSALGALAPPGGNIPGTSYSVRDGEDPRFASALGTPREKPMDLALGSGKSGMTYVSLDDSNTLTELRMSWYPSRKTWYITPGQESDADNNPGEHNTAEVSRSCMGCHAVTVPPNGLRPEDRFFGVGCQSCHGPASAHVAAAKAGRLTDLKIDRMKTWNATRINELCGRCHRSLGKVGTTGDEVTMTQRFQPYGLMQSPCFQKSGDTLSCITCHDPHTDVSRNPRAFEAACLRCHSASSSTAQSGNGPPSVAISAAMQRKVCPVNPRDKCIGCHMPKRKVFPVSKIPIAMADHLIWAYGKKKHAP